MKRLIISIIILLSLVNTVSAIPDNYSKELPINNISEPITQERTYTTIKTTETYQDYLGNTYDFNLLNLNVHPLYLVNGNYAWRQGEWVEINTNEILSYRYSFDRIIPVYIFQNETQLLKYRAGNSPNYFMEVTWNASNIKSVSDDVINMGKFKRTTKLTAMDSRISKFNGDEVSMDITSQVVGNKIKFTFKNVNYSDIVYPLILTEQTIVVNNATTIGWTTSNVILINATKDLSSGNVSVGSCGPWDSYDDGILSSQYIINNGGAVELNGYVNISNNTQKTVIGYALTCTDNFNASVETKVIYNGTSDASTVYFTWLDGVGIGNNSKLNIRNTNITKMFVSYEGTENGSIFGSYTNRFDWNTLKIQTFNNSVLWWLNNSYVYNLTAGNLSIIKSLTPLTGSYDIGASGETSYFDNLRYWQNNTGEIYIMNQSVSQVGNAINRTRLVVYETGDGKSIDVYTKKNGTSDWILYQLNVTDNTWFDIPFTEGYYIDYKILLNGNGSAFPVFNSLEYDEQLSTNVTTCGLASTDGATYTLLNSVSSTGTCFTIGANNITLTSNSSLNQINFSTTTAGYGIYNNGYSNITIKNLNITTKNTSSSSRGIYYTGVNAKFSNITNNTITVKTGRGIYLISSSNNITTTNNTISATSGVGISLSTSKNNTISNNTVTVTTGRGMNIETSSHNSVVSNNTISATSTNGLGIYLHTSLNSVISNNTISVTTDGYGIYLYSSSNTTLSNNTLTASSSGYGITLYLSSNNNTLNNNIILVISGTGIVIQSASNNSVVSNNTISVTTGDGISLYSSASSVVSNNTISVTTGGGIYLYSSSISSLTNNTITLMSSEVAGYGIYLIFSTDNTINNNTVTGTIGRGITLYSSSTNTLTSNIATVTNGIGMHIRTSSSYNTVTNNTITATSGTGIYIESASNNNTLSNNTITATSDGYGIVMVSSSNNNITDGSISSISGISYYLYSVLNNIFTNTNFTTRNIELGVANTDWFNYSNNSGLTYVSNNVSEAKTITRTLYNWTQLNITLSDSVTSGTATVYYDIIGLYSNSYYDVYNNSIFQQTLKSDTNKQLPLFKVDHNTTQKTITVVLHNSTSNQITFSNIGQTESNIYPVTQSNTISVTVNTINSILYINNVSLGITYAGVETFYNMTNNSNTWSYPFVSGVPGIYSITHFNVMDNDSAQNSTTSNLWFTVLQPTGSGTGGNGVTTPTPTPTPNATVSPTPTATPSGVVIVLPKVVSPDVNDIIPVILNNTQQTIKGITDAIDNSLSSSLGEPYNTLTDTAKYLLYLMLGVMFVFILVKLKNRR